MIHFVPNMYVSGKISALRPGTQTVMIFGTTKKNRKLPKTTRFQELRFFVCFCGLFAGCWGVLRVLSPVVWCAANIFWPVSPNPKTCNQSPKIQDLGVLGKISRYRSNSENTYIFLGFGGSRMIIIIIYICICDILCTIDWYTYYLKKKAEKNRFVTMICIIVSWDDYPKSDGTILRNNLVVFLLGWDTFVWSNQFDPCLYPLAAKASRVSSRSSKKARRAALHPRA